VGPSGSLSGPPPVGPGLLCWPVHSRAPVLRPRRPSPSPVGLKRTGTMIADRAARPKPPPPRPPRPPPPPPPPVRKWPPVSQPGGFRSMIRHARRIREWLVPLDMAHHRGRGYWRIHLFRIALLTSEASGTAGRLSVRLIASPAQSQSASEGGSRKTGWPRPWSIMTGAFLLAAETIWSWNTRFASSADWPCLPLFVAL
jgi:hypothetical protein